MYACLNGGIFTSRMRPLTPCIVLLFWLPSHQELQSAAQNQRQALELCYATGRQEALESMLRELESCSKSLQDYLESKRMAFPRFYFVAPADLLDILANAAAPQYLVK